MFRKFMMSCDEAAMICDKNQYGEASFLDKIKLQIHLLACKMCKEYTKQNSLLTKVFKKKASHQKEQHICLSSHEKENLKKELEKIRA
ncbi:MAG: hypothetical protein JXQ93_00580 [Flavobacteriaceae bacterium]